MHAKKTDLIFDLKTHQGSAATRQLLTPQGNQPSTILKFSWKSKPDPNMAIPIFTKILKHLNLRLGGALWAADIPDAMIMLYLETNLFNAKLLYI